MSERLSHYLLSDENGSTAGLNIELFAGGGGVSAGAGMIGMDFDIAINHNATALAIHKANFPHCIQMINDVFEYHPLMITQGKPVHTVHGSPDCTFHSRAKGKALGRHTVCGDDCAVDHTKLTVNNVDRVRGLGWVLIAWAMTARPNRITLENVSEFLQWGPTMVDRKGNITPDISKRGQTFEAFKGVLSTGVRKNHPALKEIRAFLKPLLGKDYDEKSLIRGLGYEVEFKELVASDYGAPTSRKRLFMIARCDGIPVTWPRPTHGNPKLKGVLSGELKPWKTAGECIDWSTPAPSIFKSKQEIKEELGLNAVRPLAFNTMRRIAKGIRKFVLDDDNPYIVGDTRPYLQTYYGEVSGETRGNRMDKPIHTITAGGQRHGLVIPYVVNAKGTDSKRMPIGNRPSEPLTTITTSDSHGIVAAHLLKFYGAEKDGEDLAKPLHTITTKERFSLIEESLRKEPLSEEERYGAWWVARMMEVYGEEPAEKLGAILLPRNKYMLTKHGFIVVDIGMRMLTVGELFLAQGFPKDFIYDPEIEVMSRGKMIKRKVTKTEAVRMVGNSVPPDFAKAIYEELNFMDNNNMSASA